MFFYRISPRSGCTGGHPYGLIVPHPCSTVTVFVFVILKIILILRRDAIIRIFLYNKYMSQLLFTTTTELVRIPSGAVVYIAADGNYSAVHTADGNSYVLTMQLGQIERRIAELAETGDNRFIRIGKSLIVNRENITYINPARQKLVLSDCRSFRHELSASREALKALKELLENRC